jgi:ankyrin
MVDPSVDPDQAFREAEARFRDPGAGIVPETIVPARGASLTRLVRTGLGLLAVALVSAGLVWFRGERKKTFPTGESVAKLAAALDAGDHRRLERLLDQGCDPSERDELGRSALHRAAAFGDTGALELLTRNKPRLDVEDRFLLTPLLLAIAGGHESATLTLLRAGANPNQFAPTSLPPLRFALMDPAESMRWPRQDFGARRWRSNLDDLTRVRLLKTLVELGADPNLLSVSSGQGALHVAAQTSSTAALDALLSLGADRELLDRAGLSPLMLAVEARRPDIVDFLLDRGVQPDARAGDGRTALHLAAQELDDEIGRTLIHRGVAPDLASRDWRTPLDLALSLYRTSANEPASLFKTRQRGFIDMLLSEGASPDGAWSRVSGPIPKITRPVGEFAARALPPLWRVIGSDAGMSLRLLDAGAAAEMAPDSGQRRSALAILALAGDLGAEDPAIRLKLAERLMERGASLTGHDFRGRAAIHAAAEAGDFDLLELFLKRGADPAERSACGWNALDHLARWENGERPPEEARLARWKDFATRFVRAGVAPNPSAPTGPQLAELRGAFPWLGSHASAPLHRLAGNRHLPESLMRHLIGLGADANARESIWGDTPLHLASSAEKVDLLVRAGAAVDGRNLAGQTPTLAQFRFPRRDEAIAALLRAGADIEARDAEGMTLFLLNRYRVQRGTFEDPDAAMSMLTALGARQDVVDRLGRSAADLEGIARSNRLVERWPETEPRPITVLREPRLGR